MYYLNKNDQFYYLKNGYNYDYMYIKYKDSTKKN